MYDQILKEENYKQTMDETVVPYLEARKKVVYLTRDEGRKLYCACYTADEPAGVMVISHGFTESEEKYKETIYYFLKNNFHVYMHDHCGHGHSYRLVDDLSLVHVDSYSRYIKDLLAVAHLAQKEHPDMKLYLYAHSMGGGVGAAALAAKPELFTKAILSSPMIRPITAGLPWTAAKSLAWILCHLGRRASYVPGGHPFDGKETFEGSPSMNRERYDYYQQKRDTIEIYQMTSPSCGWVYGAAQLNKYLRTEAVKEIKTPILLFQSENDTFVVGSEQEIFVNRINREGHTSARLVKVAGTKHEIFNSSTEVLEGYWKEILTFLGQD